MNNLENIGFTAFQCDEATLFSKDFPEIGYILCTEADNTFTISRYENGDILIRLHIDNLENVNSIFSRANEEIYKFKFEIKKAVDMLVNGIKIGSK